MWSSRCTVFCRQVLLVISKESPAQTEKKHLNCQVQSQSEVCIGIAERTRLFSDIIKFSHSHEVVVTSSECNVWNCQGSCNRDASIACNTKQRTVLLTVRSFMRRTLQNHVWFGLHDHVTNCSVWLVNNKDGSGLQPTPKINIVDNSVTLWLLNRLLIQWQADTYPRAVQLFSWVGYRTG